MFLSDKPHKDDGGLRYFYHNWMNSYFTTGGKKIVENCICVLPNSMKPVEFPELIVWELIMFGSFYLLPLQFSTGLSRPLLLFTVGLIFFGVVK